MKGGYRPGSGRPSGSKNKRTQQWENFVEYCMTGGLEKFEQELNKLEGKEFTTAFLNLLEFHQPKLSRSEVNQQSDGELLIKVIRTHAGNGKPKDPALESGAGTNGG